MDMDFAKIMQMLNSNNGGGNDMSMLMQLLPNLMGNSTQQRQNQAPPAQINLDPDEINKTLNKLYNDTQG